MWNSGIVGLRCMAVDREFEIVMLIMRGRNHGPTAFLGHD